MVSVMRRGTGQAPPVRRRRFTLTDVHSRAVRARAGSDGEEQGVAALVTSSVPILPRRQEAQLNCFAASARDRSIPFSPRTSPGITPCVGRGFPGYRTEKPSRAPGQYAGKRSPVRRTAACTEDIGHAIASV